MRETGTNCPQETRKKSPLTYEDDIIDENHAIRKYAINYGSIDTFGTRNLYRSGDDKICVTKPNISFQS